jgi:hypothetical protein
MKGSRWAEVRLALTELSKEAMQYDADGIEICFLNSKLHKQRIAVCELCKAFLSFNTKYSPNV